MKVRTIYFTGQPASPAGGRRAVPVYVTSDPYDRRAITAYELKTADSAEILAYKVEDRRAAELVVYLSSSPL